VPFRRSRTAWQLGCKRSQTAVEIAARGCKARSVGNYGKALI
jgi:hypothetical protein